MRFANTVASLVFAVSMAGGSIASAQCQGRSQNAGSTTTAAATPYTQTALTSGYNQNTLNPLGYTPQFLSPQQAMQNAQYQRMMVAMEVQSKSQSLRNQISQAQALAKQMKKDSAAMRKAAQEERAENVALREERESAKRMKNYEAQRIATRLASVQ